MPPSVLRPNSVLCGPRTNSIWLTSSSSIFEELLFNCGTPSMYVVIAGLPGLEPMPRNRALLTFRAVNSVNTEFGAKITASVMARNPESLMVCAVTAVTLAGTSLMSADSRSAVTTTVGKVTVGGAACAAEGCSGAVAPELASWCASAGEFDCANDADAARRTNKNAGRVNDIPDIILHGSR